MRRFDRQIKDHDEMVDILQRADVCRIAFADGTKPYIVTMLFGFLWEEEHPVLYFHSAGAGKKLEMMAVNNQVCFELDVDHELVKAENACECGMKYKSIVGFGLLHEVTGDEEKRMGLDLMMNHFGYGMNQEYEHEAFGKTKVLRLSVTELTGKNNS